MKEGAHLERLFYCEVTRHIQINSFLILEAVQAVEVRFF